MNNIEMEQETAISWVCSDEFHARLRVYFYVVAVIVASQLLWMIDHSVGILDKGSMESINTRTPLELGFTPLQIEKMDTDPTAAEVSGVFDPDSPV